MRTGQRAFSMKERKKEGKKEELVLLTVKVKK
jgi:hypothetical protein